MAADDRLAATAEMIRLVPSFAERLDGLRDLDAAGLTAQQRGYRLEALLHDVLLSEGLDPRSSYKIEGEQIDGSFVLDGRTMLLEAKWSGAALSASVVYAFAGKVSGKLVGTVGLMLAIGGYSEDAVTALTRGKDLDIVLADGDDLEAALGASGSFTRMVRLKLRAAADSATVYAPYRVAVDGVDHRPSDVVLGRDATRSAIAFVVEGPRDERIVGVLARRVLDLAGQDLKTDIYVGMGIANSVRLAGSLRDLYGGTAFVGVVVDADDEAPEARQRRLGEDSALRGRQVPVIAAAPTLETAWLGVVRGEALFGRRLDRAIEAALAEVDLVDLRRREPSFERFASLLERHAEWVGRN